MNNIEKKISVGDEVEFKVAVTENGIDVKEVYWKGKVTAVNYINSSNPIATVCYFNLIEKHTEFRNFEIKMLRKPPTNFHIEENLKVVANQNVFNAERKYLDELE